jgi:hypothetical protein
MQNLDNLEKPYKDMIFTLFVFSDIPTNYSKTICKHFSLKGRYRNETFALLLSKL